MLDELVGVTGWSRANARRAIATAGKRKGPTRAAVRKPRAPIYGYDSPETPYRRLIDSGVLATDQADRLQLLHAQTNPAELTRNINQGQNPYREEPSLVRKIREARRSGFASILTEA